MKQRLDRLIVERGLAPSRERAQALLLAGRVLVNEQKQTKAGLPVETDAPLRVLGDDPPYVSRGGLKLAAALRHWAIDLHGRGCVDIGVSTGGFTDCMLQAGAACVVGADTGRGQIAEKLRQDPRVTLLEDTNARLLQPLQLQQAVSAPLSFLAMDVAFISATLLLAPVLAAAPGLREAVILIKPQFEAGREWVGRGGIVTSAEAHALAQEKVRACALANGAAAAAIIDSPITGSEGNREFLLHALWNGPATTLR